MIVTKRHMLTVPGFNPKGGLCRDHAKLFAKRHGLNFRDFVRNGIEAEKLEATGDPFAIAVVQWARECAAREQAHG